MEGRVGLHFRTRNNARYYKVNADRKYNETHNFRQGFQAGAAHEPHQVAGKVENGVT